MLEHATLGGARIFAVDFPEVNSRSGFDRFDAG